MEADWILDRSHLWQLHLAHPDWGAKRLSRFTEQSLTWVKKWLRRLRSADPDDEMVLHSRSRVAALRLHGCPRAIRFDRDSRFIGSWSSGKFPSAFMRSLMCLDIGLQICPPQRPDKNPFIARYHRSYKYECLLRECPETLSQAQAVTLVYQIHYNMERPNQAVTCGNQPPRLAFPDLPALPPLPEQVDPDHWLQKIDGQFYKRRIQANGSVQVGKQFYYIRQKLKGQLVLLKTDALARQFQVLLDGQPIKQVAIKGLFNGMLDFESYFDLIRREAESEWQQVLRRRRYSRR